MTGSSPHGPPLKCLVQLDLWDLSSGLAACGKGLMSEVTHGQSLQHGPAQSVCGHLPLPNADSILALTDPLEFNHIFHPGSALGVIYPIADGWEDL